MKKLLHATLAGRAAASMLAAALAFIPIPSEASLKCQELVNQRVCSDADAKPVAIDTSGYIMVAPPLTPGFSSPCWTWQRKFQCVETTPKLYCDSGSDYATVQSSCSLTGAAINASVNISGLNFITDATYNYACSFGNYTTNDQLPTGKSCTLLNSTESESNPIAAAAPGTTPSTGNGTTSTPTTTQLNSSITTTGNKNEQYVCYSQPQTTCSDVCYQQTVDKTTGKITQQEVACTSPVTNCVQTESQCKGAGAVDAAGNTSTSASWGPDGRCVDSNASFMCQAGPVPACLTNTNCQLTKTQPTSVQANGVATSQSQTYTCSNETKTCTQFADVSNCVHTNAWGWDGMTLKSQVAQGLGDYNSAMAKVQGIAQGMNNQDPYIFSGQNLKCHYAVGNFLNTFIMVAIMVAAAVMSGGTSVGLMSTALQSAGMSMAAANATAAFITVAGSLASDAPNSKAMGSNCCKDYIIEGSDRWYKLGSCTSDEIKLAVAKNKGLQHYLGEYCSKKGGFPLRQCVEMSKSYCVFDDMLALTVNEQGRQQLDAIANADSATTKNVGPNAFNLYTPAQDLTQVTKYSGVLDTGKWVKLAQANNSQVWTWQYPSYCANSDSQAAAYNIYQAELDSAMNAQGIQPSKMTKDQALKMLAGLVNIHPFQECPSSPGRISFMTCNKLDDSCDATALPEGPTGVQTDFTGSNVSTADVNWTIQQMDSFVNPGDYGVTSTMPTDSTFAASSNSVNQFMTAIGSCHADGNCLYNFAITDKQATGGLGAHKRTTDYAQFPLYTISQTSVYPAISYLSQDGTLDQAAYQADPVRGATTPLTVGSQRFIFHPNLQTGPLTGNIHKDVLLEWATKKVKDNEGQNDYTPILVPTNLPPGTDGFNPYGNVADNASHYYMSGGCDPNSHWCNYAISVDLNVPRHPWGSAENPRCWGFTVDQIAALDFDKMDLSRWINSLDLSSASNGLSADAAKAMTTQVTNSAQAMYSAMQTGGSIATPTAGTVALVTNTDTLPKLSNDSFTAYTLTVALPANWPQYYDNQPNINPVTNVWVNWGDGSPMESMKLDTGGRGYLAKHDYGDDPVGTYKIVVQLDTVNNGTQVLSTNVRITPDSGKTMPTPQLDFNNPGTDGQSTSSYTPSAMSNGTSQAPSNLQQISPATVDQYNTQGTSITK